MRVRCGVEDARTAPAAEENATAISSPIVENTTPPWCPNAAWSVSLCRTRARAIAVGSVSHSRAEPSISVKAKVTVPQADPPPGLARPGRRPARRRGAFRRAAEALAQDDGKVIDQQALQFLGVAKVRYDVIQAARMLSINAVRRGS